MKTALSAPAEILRQELRFYCKSQNISQQALAGRMKPHGASPYTVLSLINGRIDPTVKTLSQIADAFAAIGGTLNHETLTRTALSATAPPELLSKELLSIVVSNRPESDRLYILKRLIASLNDASFLADN